MPLDVDIVIVGAGIVGATLASGCVQLGLKVALIDAKAVDASWDANRFDPRVAAITRASEAIFKNLGAWEAIAAKRTSVFREMFVWDAMGRGEIHFDSAKIQAPHLGQIIENRVLEASLLEGLVGHERVEIRAPHTVAQIEVEAAAVTIQLASGEKISAKLLVGADGANSQIRQLMGIGMLQWDYGQSALVARVKTSKPNQHTAWQRFLPDGPLAFLPLSEFESSIVWSNTPAQVARLLDEEEVEFTRELTEAFAEKLGEVVQVQQRTSFALSLQHASEYVRPRLALIGDAAHRVHPLAGQGANLGLLDAAALVQVLEAAVRREVDIGRYGVLRRYERWRKGHNLLTMGIMDGFKRGFGARATPIVNVRNAGLALFNRSDWLKNQIMRHASGVRGELPALAAEVSSL